MKKKNIGIIIDGLNVNKQIYDFVNESENSKNYLISTLIIQKNNLYTGSILNQVIHYFKIRGIFKLFNNVAFHILLKIEKYILCRFNDYKNFFKYYKLDKNKFKIIEVYQNISPNGVVYRYNNEDITKIKSCNLNLLVRCGNGILYGEILNICENGIISFHHADNEINRGGPPGFWEIIYREPRTGFIIQKLNEELDGGDVFYKGFIPTSWIYTLNLIMLYESSNPVLKHVIDDITSEKPKLKTFVKKPYYDKIFTTPSIIIQLLYILITFKTLLKKISLKITHKDYRWGVSYQFTENWQNTSLYKSKKIPNPPNRYLADPFIIKQKDYHYCFVEDYNFKKTKGKISVYKINEKECIELGVALEENFHLSYPFIFKYKNNIYMCPETHQARDIRIYKCINFPLEWKFDRVLLDDISAADTNIFKFNGMWWMMFTVAKTQYSDHRYETNLFYSDNPLSNNWKEHPKNPIFFDPFRAQNGGLIYDKSKVFRVYQKHGFGIYGESLGVSEIKFISNNSYFEESLFEIKPRFFNGIIGTHTFNYTDGLLVFDFVKVNSTKN